MQDAQVLVTGGAGFIGSNLANQLADAGNDVIPLDNDYLGAADNLADGVEHVDGDVPDDDLPTDVGVVFHRSTRRMPRGLTPWRKPTWTLLKTQIYKTSSYNVK